MILAAFLALASQSLSLEADSVSPALTEWRLAHGSSWRVNSIPEAPFAEMLYGGRLQSAVRPLSDADWFALSRQRIAEARSILGVDVDSCVDGRVLLLPLGWIGSTDKFAVSFEQALEGIKVEGAALDLLYDSSGGLLSIQSSCAVGALISAPFEIKRDEIDELMLSTFSSETGLEGELVSEARRAWWRIEAGGVRPAWIAEVSWEAAATVPVSRRLILDAGDGKVLFSYSTIQHFDVTGHVRSQVTPGEFPDWTSNPEVWAPVPYVNLTGSFGQVQTDKNGDFVIQGVNGPVDVTATFLGEYSRVEDQAGPNFTVTTSISDGGTISMNSDGSEFNTAQSNAYFGMPTFRDWLRSVSPGDDTADILMQIRTNLDNGCNAYYSGYVTTYRNNGTCPNMAYNSIIAHEIGHGMNNRYGTYDGESFDGMGEGAADIWAMYLYDTPVVGMDFYCENCGPLRTGLNTRQFCGDDNSSCYDSPHANGEPYMGAAWKVRANLNTTLGDAFGDLAADSLLLGWHSGFNQTKIREIIETQWLLLDDDDGDLFNGSPHFSEIDGGFRAQGWPGLDIQPVTIEPVQLVENTEVERGPYDVRAIAETHFGQALSSVELLWRSGADAWQSEPMVLQQDHVYVGSIPDVLAPATISYYISATDVNSDVATHPREAPALTHSFEIGASAPVFVAQFDDPLSDAGWTHGSYGDTSNGADDWERGVPAGKQGSVLFGAETVYWFDPSAAFSGAFSWGNDLGNGTDGRYPNNAHMWLRSPAIDASSWIGTRLQFQRQLSVLGGDQARVLVNGQPVFDSSSATSTSDSDWVLVDYELGSLLDGDPAAQLEWELLTDGVPRIGGWNIDDVEIWALSSSNNQDCVDPVPFGPGKLHSGSAVAELSYFGQPAVASSFGLKIEYAVANQPSLLFSGANPALIPFAGGYRLATGNIRRNGAAQLSLAGSANFPLGVSAAMAGTTRFYQVWFRDPANTDATGVGLSPGLRVDYCF